VTTGNIDRIIKYPPA